MKTEFMLLAKYETPTIPLEFVAEDWLNMKKQQACRKAATHSLPFPAFKLGSQKAGWFVHLNDLAAYIDSQREQAEKEFRAIAV